MELIIQTGMEVHNMEDDVIYPTGEPAKELCRQVNQKLNEEHDACNLAEYLNIEKGVITEAYPSAEFRDNKPAGIVTMTCKRELSQEEMEKVRESLYGQFADGWGEGFEANEFDIGEDTVYIYFII